MASVVAVLAPLPPLLSYFSTVEDNGLLGAIVVELVSSYGLMYSIDDKDVFNDTGVICEDGETREATVLNSSAACRLGEEASVVLLARTRAAA